MINIPVNTLDKLLPLLLQCKQYDAETLKSTRLHLVRNMDTLKTCFDSDYNNFLQQLSQINSEILYKTYRDRITKHQKDKAAKYWAQI